MTWIRSAGAAAVLSGLSAGLLWLAESPAVWRQPMERGEKRAIAVHVAAGQAVVATVEQWEIDLTLWVRHPDGRVVRGADRGPFGLETLLFVAEVEGDYTLNVEAGAQGSKGGEYALRGLEVRRGGAAERAGVEAQERFARAEELERQPTGENQARARALYGEAAALFRASGLSVFEAQAISNEGRALDRTGRRDAAYALYMSALRIWERTGDAYGRLETLRQIGRLSGHLKENFSVVPDDAGFLAMSRELGDRRGIAHAMSVMSGHCRRERNLSEAAGWAERSVQLARQLGDKAMEARCLKSLCLVQGERGQYERAVLSARRMLSLYRDLSDVRGESASLGQIGSIFLAAKRYAEAIPYLSRQIELLRIHGDQTGLAEGLWGLAHVYMEMGDPEAAEMVQKQMISAYSKTAGQFDSAKWRSAYLGVWGPFGGRTRFLIGTARVVEALGNVDGLRAAAFGAQGKSGITESLSHLDPDTVLIETMTGEEGAEIWVADSGGVRAYQAPGGERLTALAQKVWNCYAARSECGPEAKELSGMLLGPAWPEIRGKRLVIAGDGILSYFPFGALPEPTGNSDAPILLRQEVVLVPSLTTMDLLRRRRGPMGPWTEARVLADPVYDAQDQRLNARAAAPPRLDQELVRAIEGGGLRLEKGAIPRLWNSGAEVEGLFERLPAQVERAAYSGFDATREALLKPIPRGSILHIATHGIVNEDDPELSGLVLALWNRDGRPVDGYVPIRDLASMNFPARLVVLSACQTACGRQYFGLGAFSLASEFLRTGAQTVVASSWKVNDAATAELMKLFYRHLMSDGEMRVPKALRAAQLEMRGKAQWSQPYYWAAFSAYGEWR